MTAKLENTGERMIPEHHMGRNKYGAHFGRYQAGLGITKGKVVLDIACGTGYGSKLMSKTAVKVYGVDVAEDTVAYAQENFGAKNIEYRVGDGIAIPLKDKSVDVVVSYETIEHIADYEKFMSEVKRVLRPDGILLLSTPNALESSGDNRFHLHEFTYDELMVLVKKYFEHRVDYFQTAWVYNTVLPEKLQAKEWQKRIMTTNTCAIQSEQSTFFFMICSDKEVKGEIEPQGIIGEQYHQPLLQDADKVLAKARSELEKARKQITDFETQQQQIVTLKKQLHLMQNSRAWRVARWLQKASDLSKHFTQSIKTRINRNNSPLHKK